MPPDHMPFVKDFIKLHSLADERHVKTNMWRMAAFDPYKCMKKLLSMARPGTDG